MRSKLVVAALSALAATAIACGSGGDSGGSTGGNPPPPPPPAATTAPPGPVAMPNVVGLNAAVAGDRLEKLGFTNIEYGSQDPNHSVVILRSNWTVTKQSTKAGARVDPTDLVVLTCTKQ